MKLELNKDFYVKLNEETEEVVFVYLTEELKGLELTVNLPPEDGKRTDRSILVEYKSNDSERVESEIEMILSSSMNSLLTEVLDLPIEEL